MGNYMSPDNSTLPLQPTLQKPSTDNSQVGDYCDSGESGSASDQHVIIPVDASKEAQSAFDWYMRHVHRPSYRVHVIHCYEIEFPSGKHFPDYAIPPEHWNEKMEQARINGQGILGRFKRQLDDLKVNSETHNRFGKPGQEIVNAAKGLNATMIVMGTRGMGFIRRTILGSVSSYVVHHTNIPVTMVPRPATKTE